MVHARPGTPAACRIVIGATPWPEDTVIECSGCGRMIGSNSPHWVFRGNVLTRTTAVLCVFCEVCTNGSAPELHTLVHPGCSVPGHDLWNHSEWALAKNGAEARSAVWAWMVRDRRDERGPETAADLIALGVCSGACLVASLESFGGCDCRCRGEWHGVLADAPVKSRWNVARMTPDPAPNADTGVVTLGDLPEPVPSPWPHFPHCPGCSRRLWAKSQRMPGPREDGTCPYCATLVVSSKWVMS